MSLENLAEKSPEERIEAIKVFEEASRKCMDEALDTSEKARKSMREVHERLAKSLGLSKMEMENFAMVKSNLTSQDQENWEHLKKLVDKIYTKKLKELKIAKKKPEKSTNPLDKIKILRV